MPYRARRARRQTAFALPLLLVVILLVGGASLVFALPQLDLDGRRIPAIALDAYLRGARAAPTIRQGCEVDWPIVAALGKVESDHGRAGNAHRAVSAAGTVHPAIIGPPLDGSAGTATIHDTDKGALDGDTRFDHAVGPMQFIPSTWRELGRDGNGDGVKDPNNLYDAALTAVAHLCLREPGNYAIRSQLHRSLVAYNRSGTYADRVLGWVETYRSIPLSQLASPTS